MQTGTASNAYQQFGLKQFPAAGKTGTAYNFTDVWFVGYDSEITCGVWAGFDKPQTIFRGAFSNQIALPVWTDIMNASLAKQPPRELGRPIDLKRVEVCLDTGLPASPKCMLTSVADPWSPPRKGTFFEFSTAKQLPKETCWLHGDDTRSFVRTLRSQDAPRAASATDQAQVAPVLMRAPTLLGDDPYQSVKPRPKEPPQLAQSSESGLDSSSSCPSCRQTAAGGSPRRAGGSSRSPAATAAGRFADAASRAILTMIRLNL